VSNIRMPWIMIQQLMFKVYCRHLYLHQKGMRFENSLDSEDVWDISARPVDLSGWNFDRSANKQTCKMIMQWWW
jgi:hypothetical protein